MTDLTTEPTTYSEPATAVEPIAPAPKPRRPRKTARPGRRFLIVTHRWLSLVLGIVLLLITTTGAVLVYRPEIERWTSHGAYDASGKAPTTTLADARATVLAAHPDFAANSVWAEHGVFRVTDYETSYTVDPGTGKILGFVGADPGWLKVMDQIHECFFACEDYPAYIGFLNKPIPHTTWLGSEGEKITGGGLILGVLALLLLYLSLTGLWLWFPRRGKRPGKWKKSVSVRWKRGRFARDTDLHNVAGLIAIPLLVVWAATGASYELGFVEKAWYAATPGKQVEGGEAASATWIKDDKNPPKDESAKPADITPEQATAAAQALHPKAKLVNIDLPQKPDPKDLVKDLETYNAADLTAYTFYFSDGYDPWAHSAYPGEVGVYVDRRTGKAATYYGDPDQSLAQTLYDDFNYPVHSGYFVNGWWKIIWFVIGLSPVLLAITGVSTWLVRRKTRKARQDATP